MIKRALFRGWLKVGGKMPYRKLLIILVVVMGLLLVLPWLSITGQVEAAVVQQGSTPNIRISKSKTGPFRVGFPGTFQIVVDNFSTVTVTGPITVTDSIPGSMPVTGVNGAGWTCGNAGQLVTCSHDNPGGLASLAALPPILITVDIGQTAVPSVSNTAILTNLNDTIPGDNTTTYTTTVEYVDLAVTKSVTPLAAAVTDIVTYTVRVTNNGPSTATGVVLTDTLPVDVTYASSNATAGTTIVQNNGTITWTAPTLNDNQIITATIRAAVAASALGMTVTNTTGEVSSDLYDNNSTNNTGSASFQVKPDLTITKTDGNKSTVLPGETYTYTLTVTNIGPIPATGYVITDTISPYLTWITDTVGVDPTESGNDLIWRLPTETLDQNESRTYQVRVRADSSFPNASTLIVNTAKVGTSLSELNLINNTATDTNSASGSHNVSLTLSVTPTAVRTGQNATYTIRVSNSGSASVTDVIVTDTFSQYVDVSSASTSKGSRTIDSAARRVTANIGTLDANQTATISVVTTVNNTARTNVTVSNSASASYRFGGSTFTKTSSSASFSLVFSTTLPGTGGMELRVKDAPPGVITIATLSAILLAGIGVLTFIYGLRLRSRQSDWGGWALRMGLLFTFAGLLFGLAAWGFSRIPSTQPQATMVALLRSSAKTMATPQPPEDPPWEGMVLNEEPDPLPDFPIPEPTHNPQDENGQTTDTSPVNRIVLPSLGVDTIVKYVPFDGLTWLIAGLQDEVAWMGDTSWPGLGSNTGFAGHVTLWNGRDGPFRNLDQLQTNDPVTIYTEENQYTYQVREKVVVSDIEMSVIQPASGSQITLITCTNWDAAASLYRDRLVVSADLVSVTPIQGAVQGN